ncbi:MAG: tRNA preQ1(34) S-adenosylmethionine ribosyltransferase-isomerase QueA [Nitrospirae bacterium]|nr:tRNA preQ1(34) S-adenosylmethionine ribosyltransferase-isomerase QueA [Nitrospirota bacterium]
MKLSDFDYQISSERIAQYPLIERDSSKLFVIRRDSGRFEHRIFRDIIDYLQSGDVLILNNTKVIPVRIYGVKPTGGKVEITLLKERSGNDWDALVTGVRQGEVMLAEGITAYVSRSNGKPARVEFEFRRGNTPLNPLLIEGKSPVTPDIKTVLDKIGAMPLPPYIKREAVQSDRAQYQTVYAERDGAVAAPTAGLHFTDKLLRQIRDKGIIIKTITLHVGHGTFKPVTVSDIGDHRMDEEYYEIPADTAHAINSAKSEGRRVIAVGTTATRALEAANTPLTPSPLERGAGVCNRGELCPPLEKGLGSRCCEALQREVGGFSDDNLAHIKSGPGKASIFLYPGCKFNIIDALITNFHQPKSTPMMLTSAFAGLDLLKKAYCEAQKKEYRFFSYGDAMLII